MSFCIWSCPHHPLLFPLLAWRNWIQNSPRWYVRIHLCRKLHWGNYRMGWLCSRKYFLRHLSLYIFVMHTSCGHCVTTARTLAHLCVYILVNAMVDFFLVICLSSAAGQFLRSLSFCSLVSIWSLAHYLIIAGIYKSLKTTPEIEKLSFLFFFNSIITKRIQFKKPYGKLFSR